MASTSGPTIAAPIDGWQAGNFRDITIYGGSSGGSGTLEWKNGEGESNSVPFTFNEQGHVVVTILVPSWEQIILSIDEDTWEDDVSRTIG